jgi:hypothetical protein
VIYHLALFLFLPTAYNTIYSFKLSFNDSSSKAAKVGIERGNHTPTMGPFWFTPGGLGFPSDWVSVLSLVGAVEERGFVTEDAVA